MTPRGGVRRAVAFASMLCACGEPVAPVGPNEVRIPKGWSACFRGKYEPAQDGVPVVLRVTQTMPDFQLRALCVTVESGVVAAGDSRDVTPSGLERHLALRPGNHVFVMTAQFLAPRFPGYKFDIRSSHALDLPEGTTWTLTAHFYEAEKSAINERPTMEWQEERGSPASSVGGGGLGDGGAAGTGD